MEKVFIDASVLFSASLSATGASREIIRYAFLRKISLVVNELVFQEVERNLRNKRPEVLESFFVLKNALPFEMVEPTKEEVLEVAPYTALKDAPHLAAARKAQVYCLVSLDRRHMIEVREEIEKHLGLKILLPGELLQELRKSIALALPPLDDVPPEEADELAAMALLNDASLWREARNSLAAEQQTELQNLLDRQAEGELSPQDKSRLQELLDAYGRLTVRKAHAWLLLARRGYRIPPQA